MACIVALQHFSVTLAFAVPPKVPPICHVSSRLPIDRHVRTLFYSLSQFQDPQPVRINEMRKTLGDTLLMDDLRGLWPDDERINDGVDGAHFKMGNEREYVASASLLAAHPTILRDSAPQFTRYIDEHPEENPVIFNTDNAKSILSRSPIRVSDQVKWVMRMVVMLLNGRPGKLDFEKDGVSITPLMRTAYLSSFDDLRAIFRHLDDRGLIAYQETSSSFHLRVPVSALIDMEADLDQEQSDTAFVAMWFGKEMSAVYEEAIAPAVERAGYRPIRIDHQEHNNKIDDEIIAEVRRARFIIADFSCGADGARGGVYYEAGFAAGLGKPVIYMVREADLGGVDKFEPVSGGGDVDHG